MKLLICIMNGSVCKKGCEERCENMKGRKGQKKVHKAGGKRARNLALLVLCAIALGGLLCGCEKSDEKINVSTLHNYVFPNFEKLVEETYSDIDFQSERVSNTGEQIRRLEKGEGADFIISTQMTEEQTRKYYLDISDTAASTAYDGTVMKQTKLDGKTYSLPLPGQYKGYIINETLFKEAGVSIPKSNEELVEALSTLKEKGVGIGEDGCNFAIESSYNADLAHFYIGNMVPDFLGTMQGVEWLEKYNNKKATMAGTWESAFTLSDQLVEAGVLDAAAVGQQRKSVVVHDRMAEGNLAAVFGSSSLYSQCISKNKEAVEKGTATEYSYKMLPLYSNEGNESWVLFTPIGYIGINKAISEEKQEACLRILELLSTPEGQKAMQQDLEMGVSSLKDYDAEGKDIPAGIEKTIESGYVYNLDFPEQISEYFGSSVRKMMAGTLKKEEVLQTVDEYYYKGSKEVDYNLSVVGAVDHDMLVKDFNVRIGETEIGNFMADCVAEASKAPIAVVNGGGIRGSFYEGEVYGEDLEAVSPFDNKIVVLDMDGQTLWDMLENGLAHCTDEFPTGQFLQISGLEYTFDSSKEAGKRLVKVTLSDGKTLDLKGQYRVAVNDYMAGAQGYAEGNGDGFTMLNYYDKDTAKGNVKLVSETDMTYRDALRAYFEKHKEPVDVQLEGRIKDQASKDNSGQEN